ncbi:nucleotidyltransferase domain-containing protein [Sutcliffiella rhizosphaerae]|uniref:Renal dipeptidase n=1 Tax=Sutcliffiella rhizosphaerae TaxID=2880967 RepID=A0ABN8ADG5_9BACI|nr:nucleotidyltransferase family protein [Sutcliffiella rhizosphaerae]CAG9620755.1 hypothetical protein BACCIP111883_01525 [Sutcliffiella rhizosphaerae]
MKGSGLDLTNVPKEILFMGDLLKDVPVDQLEISDNMDWELFIDFSLHHRLFPILHQKVKNANKIPVHVRETLAIYYKQNAFRMLQLSAEMINFHKHFVEKEIPMLFLKGPNLAHDLYGNVSLRTCSDLDVLVPIDRLQDAEEILLNQGFEKDDYIQTILGDWTWRHHHFTYIHKEKELKVEIHWRLNPGPGYEPTFRQLWEHRRKSNLTKKPLYMLGKEHQFFFLVTHGARHGWSRLRWLFDIHQMLKQEIDWEMVLNIFKKHHYTKVGFQALLLARALFQSKMPIFAECKKSRKLAQSAIYYLERKVNLHKEPLPEEISKYHEQYLFGLMSIQQKLLYSLSLFFPYPEDAQRFPLPKRLHFLYFPLRPILGGIRMFKKQTFLKKPNYEGGE